jgi:MSHA pilin protein MshC
MLSIIRIRFLKGFTLVELIATLIIIALIAAVTGPRFFNVSSFRESGFFEETLSAVRYAQKHAVATGCPVRVQVTANGFTLLSVNPAVPADVSGCNTTPYPSFGTVILDPSGNAATFTRTAPSDIALSPQDFTFFPLGNASATVTVTVGARQFRVIDVTGFVQRL